MSRSVLKQTHESDALQDDVDGTLTKGDEFSKRRFASNR